MPNDARISQLLDLLDGDLNVAKLEKLTREFQGLAQDRAESSALFVLHSVAYRLACELNDEAVEHSRFQEITADISEKMAGVLTGLQQGRSVVAELDALVSTLFRNVGLYRSQDR
jgi:hypothetical protein